MITVYDEILEKLGDKNTDPDLKNMILDLSKAPALYQPSEFWIEYMTMNLKQLNEQGQDNFKRTVNQNYFNWIKDLSEEQCSTIAPSLSWFSKTTVSVNSFLNNPGAYLPKEDWSDIERAQYAKFVCYLWEFARKHDKLHLLDNLEEPTLGNPLGIKYLGKLISQDISNSVMEIDAAAEGFGDKLPTNLHVGELGAGYGRNAYVLLKKRTDIKVTIIDIPPALHLCQWYLSKLFPDRKIFKYRPFSSYEQVHDEFESSSIKFLLPQQVEQLPDNTFDLFLNISSLQEMTAPQIEMWFENIDRLCHGYFYSKQWICSNNPFDNILIKREDYPVRKSWTELFNRDCTVQTKFFEALYSIV